MKNVYYGQHAAVTALELGVTGWVQMDASVQFSLMFSGAFRLNKFLVVWRWWQKALIRNCVICYDGAMYDMFSTPVLF